MEIVDEGTSVLEKVYDLRAMLEIVRTTLEIRNEITVLEMVNKQEHLEIVNKRRVLLETVDRKKILEVEDLIGAIICLVYEKRPTLKTVNDRNRR